MLPQIIYVDEKNKEKFAIFAKKDIKVFIRACKTSPNDVKMVWFKMPPKDLTSALNKVEEVLKTAIKLRTFMVVRDHSVSGEKAPAKMSELMSKSLFYIGVRSSILYKLQLHELHLSDRSFQMFCKVLRFSPSLNILELLNLYEVSNIFVQLYEHVQGRSPKRLSKLSLGNRKDVNSNDFYSFSRILSSNFAESVDLWIDDNVILPKDKKLIHQSLSRCNKNGTENGLIVRSKLGSSYPSFRNLFPDS